MPENTPDNVKKFIEQAKSILDQFNKCVEDNNVDLCYPYFQPVINSGKLALSIDYEWLINLFDNKDEKEKPFISINEIIVPVPPQLPTTLDEAVDYLLPRFVGMEHHFLEMSEDEFASFCHSQLSGGIGMQIRNEFGLWTKDTAIYRHIVELHPQSSYPDDMSDLIIRAVYNRKKKAI